MNPIYHEYKRLAKETLDRCEVITPIVLKTDVCNEIRDKIFFNVSIDTSRWFWVDIDSKLIYEARKNFSYMNVINNDIRELIFRDKFFDIIMDFSTIDHVSEYKEVLNQYARVLKENGILLIVVWLDLEFRKVEGQYYFKEEDFIYQLSLNFSIIKKEIFPDAIGGDGRLTAFMCRRH